MKHFQLLCVLFLFSYNTAFAHGDTDWRNDKKAFASAKLEALPSINKGLKKNYTFYDIDMEFFKEKLAQFSGAEDITINGETIRIRERSSQINKTNARKFLKQEYELLGYKVRLHDYGRGINFIAEKKGTSDKILILSAHMDSVGNAGANDDGIGVVAGLAIAKSLENESFQHTLRFIAFDQEERGLIGSKNYVSKIKRDRQKQNIIADIQLEMLGTNRRNDGKFHVIDCNKNTSNQVTSEIMNAVVALGLPLQRVSACTDASDHSPFWDAGIPAIAISENFFGGDSDPCYHRSCDIFDERLNFEYASNIAKAIASASAKILKTR